MGISKYFNAQKAKQEIEIMLNKRIHNEYLRNECGKILNDLGRMHGYEMANQIIEDLNLDKCLNLKMVCPATNNIVKKKD
jgi:hypothetical protein